MNAVLLISCMLCLSLQNVFSKQYNINNSKMPLTFCFGSTAFASLVFICNSGFKFSFRPMLIPYSLCFAAAYICASLGLVVAIGCGSMSLSSLLINYSLIIPGIYGIAFLDEQIKPTMVIGMLFFFISMALVNLRTGEEKSSKKTAWLIAITVAFVGNGMCSTVQKMQQLKFSGGFKNEFMLLSFLFIILIMLPAGLAREKQSAFSAVKGGWQWFAFYGLANGLVNLLVMVTSAKIPVSVLFPVISAGGIIISSAVSVLVYGEKLSRRQSIGIIIGLIAIVFLNL